MLTQMILSPQKEDKYSRGLVILDLEIYREFPFGLPLLAEEKLLFITFFSTIALPIQKSWWSYYWDCVYHLNKQ